MVVSFFIVAFCTRGHNNEMCLIGGPVTDSAMEFSFLVKRIPDSSSLTKYIEDSDPEMF